jgi:hypothetical protein
MMCNTNYRIIGVIKSRKMEWARHVARKEGRRSAFRVWLRTPEGRRPLGKPSLNGRIIVK